MALTHGGDTEGYFLDFGNAPLDFSANCNPLGVPEGVRLAIAEQAATADMYPDPLCRRLRAALSAKLGIPARWFLCGNGAADLIFRLALAVRPKSALVTAPTFSEYELALRVAGCTAERHPLSPGDRFALTEGILSRITPETDMLFICNPNNPTGETVEPALLGRIADTCAQTGTLLVVDECFNGFLDAPGRHSLKERLPDYDNLLILDAFTKLYGMAGVRLGYCMSRNEPLLEAMKNAGQPWAVSSLAQAAGIAALDEDDYVARSRLLIRAQRERMAGKLRALGFELFGGQANYLFFRCDIPQLAEILRREGILIRDCGNYHGLGPGYYRLAVRTQAENDRLLAALSRLTDPRRAAGEEPANDRPHGAY